jgi:hypothetical protein
MTVDHPVERRNASTPLAFETALQRQAAASVVTMLLLLIATAGCGNAVDSRLVGVWETRQGFAKSTRIKFASDGSAIVATKTNRETSEPISGSWHVVATDGNNRLTVKISLSGKGSRERVVKFLNEDLIEMSEGTDGGVRRYTRVAGE